MGLDGGLLTVYTIPNRPSGSDPRAIAPILANFDAVLAALNSFDGANIQLGTVAAGALADAGRLGLTDGATVRRGKAIIPGEETRANAVFGLMPTPDRVQNVNLTTDGLIVLAYEAQWKHNAGGVSPEAAIFLGANQLKARESGGTLGVQAGVPAYTGGGVAGIYNSLLSCPLGLISEKDATSSVPDPVTTGQAVGVSLPAQGSLAVGANYRYGFAFFGGGLCYIHAAAGTYDVSIQVRNASAGDKTTYLKNRKLWVWTIGF